VASVSHLAPIHLGLDVHRDTISVGILTADMQVPEVDKIPHDEPSVRRLVARFPNPGGLRACYEAGPTGFELARLLHSMGVSCQVIAPSLIPKAPGDRVKTDKRDCRRLARLHRASELVAIRIPTLTEEAVRDLCRTRGDMVEDRMRARHRLSKFLLRHGQVWRAGRRGRWPMSRGRSPSGAPSPRCRRPTTTPGQSCKAATRNWKRSRPTLPAGMTAPRSPSRWPAWPPTGA
jgi:transposase